MLASRARRVIWPAAVAGGRTQESSGTIPYRPMTLADLAGHLAAAGDDRHRWRLVAEFLEEYRHEPAGERPALLVDEPPSSRYERWDVLLAALAEHLATSTTEEPPPGPQTGG